MQAFATKDINIFYWRINRNDGSYTQSGEPLTPQRVQESIDVLNYKYAALNICFNLKGMDTINSTAHHTGSGLNAINTYAEANNYAKQDAFNVYVPHRLAIGSGQGSYNRSYIALNDVSVSGGAIIHELGHNFNLIHTFGKSNYLPHPTNCERVTRLNTDPEYNALDNGDEVHDTAAVPNFFREQHNHVGRAIEQANLGTWWDGRNIAFLEDGFNDLPNSAAIEQALVAYGFTQAEVIHLKFNAAINHAYSDTANCLYGPDNRINDLNSPFFKDCGGSPYEVFEADCRNYMSYYSGVCDKLYSTGQGIRVHEAIENDVYGEFAPRLSNTALDLYIQDTETDIGQEPNIHTTIFWNSEEIWVRNQDDGTVVQEHENPEYDPVEPNYAYVKVNNKACNSSTGNEQLKLYWAKANTALSWPLHWEGDLTLIDSNGLEVLMGDEIGTMDIPAIGAGESTILEFEWLVPNPEDYMDINNANPWHFCLLARMVSTLDPMTFPEQTFITDNVKENNNIAWKNMTIVDVFTDSPSPTPVGAVVAVGNFLNVQKNYTLEFFKEDNEVGKQIYDEAEISITLDDVIYNAWNNGGKTSENFSSTAQDNTIIVENNYALLENIQLAPNVIGTISVNFNFLTDELTNKTKYVYHLIQRDAATNKVIGGETFEIRKQPRPIFDADAGSDESVDQNEIITISAGDINEAATYNWYDPEGNLIYSGTDLTVSADITQTYQLEVVSSIDGFKDYDEVEITVNPHRIESLVPNPVTSQLTVNYVINGVTSAYIIVLDQSTGATNNYILDVNDDEVILDVTGYPTGLYSVILVCDGETQDSKNLVKQ